MEESPVHIAVSVKPQFGHILTPGALEFVADLHRRFNPERERCLCRREVRARGLRAGIMPDFLRETKHIRDTDWKVALVPADLQDRRVEITGPASSRKMVINALNSSQKGVKVYMADSEDSESPTWDNIMNGQLNLYDAVRRTISLDTGGKQYRLAAQPAVLMFRPRGWHLTDKHFLVDGQPVSASLLDFGLYFYHNILELLRRGTSVYLYLPKTEGHPEARLWNEVFQYSQARLGVPNGSIKATVLIETILAAFEMDEILYELREHSAGLNCGRWDYIFSYIKKLGHDPAFLLPDPSAVTMDQAFLKAYVELLIKTCHRRGAHAMGGMSAFVPTKDPATNAVAFDKVREDKLREVLAGHDGTWIAHPDLAAPALEAFDMHMPGPNQLNLLREDVNVTAADLLKPHTGRVTLAGLRLNAQEGVEYIQAWLNGLGCKVINNLMSDAATAERSRTQIWQQILHRVQLAEGARVTPGLVNGLLADIAPAMSQQPNYEQARSLFMSLITPAECPDFLTIPAYETLCEQETE